MWKSPTCAASAEHCNRWDQVPFYPPNVKGWPGGNIWISTSSLFVRYNTAVYLAGGARSPNFAPAKAVAAACFVRRRRCQGVDFDPAAPSEPSEEVVDHWVARLIGREYR